MQKGESMSSRPEEAARISSATYLMLMAAVHYEGNGEGVVHLSRFQAVYQRILEEAGVTPNRIVIYDNSQIFIDGQKVEDLTALQMEIFIYLHEKGSASIDEMMEDVWHRPDLVKQGVYVALSRINAVLRKHSCHIATKAGRCEIKFSNISKNITQ